MSILMQVIVFVRDKNKDICSYLQDALRSRLRRGTTFEVNIVGDHQIIRNVLTGHLSCGREDSAVC